MNVSAQKGWHAYPNHSLNFGIPSGSRTWGDLARRKSWRRVYTMIGRRGPLLSVGCGGESGLRLSTNVALSRVPTRVSTGSGTTWGLDGRAWDAETSMDIEESRVLFAVVEVVVVGGGK